MYALMFHVQKRMTYQAALPKKGLLMRPEARLMIRKVQRLRCRHLLYKP